MRIEFARFFDVVIVVLTLHGTDNFKLTNSEKMKVTKEFYRIFNQINFCNCTFNQCCALHHRYDGKDNGPISQCKSAMYM